MYMYTVIMYMADSVHEHVLKYTKVIYYSICAMCST